MKYSADWTNCHCCVHGAPNVPRCDFLLYHNDGTLVDSLFEYEIALTFFQAGDSDLRSLFNIESFENGATVDSFDVSYVLNETLSGPGKSSLIDMTVTSAGAGDFASGVIFWPKSYGSATPSDPRCAVPGYQFKFLTGYGFIRNALIEGQQFYETVSDADPTQPLPFAGLVVEFAGTKYFSVGTAAEFGRCWEGAGGGSWGSMPYEGYTQYPNATTLGGNGEKNSSTITHWCMDKSNGDITRVGFCYGLTSYDTTWQTRSLGQGTWTQSSYLSRLTSQSCYTGRCNCYHCDITTLQLTFNSGSNLLPFQGQTITLTRTPGLGGVGTAGWEYTGSVSGTETAAKGIQTLTQSTGDMLPNPNPTGLRAWVAAKYGTNVQFDTDNLVEVDPVGGLVAADIEAHLNALPGIDVAVTCASSVPPTGGGAVTITSAIDGPMNCFQMSGHLTEADGVTIVFQSGFSFAPLRLAVGNVGGSRSADITLTLDPRFPSAGTENATLRAERSCCKLEIAPVGSTTQIWYQATNDDISHDPVLLEFVNAGGPSASCLAGDPAVQLYYSPKAPPPAANSITSWGWDVTVTE